MSETTGQKHTDYPYKRYVENKSRMTVDGNRYRLGNPNHPFYPVYKASGMEAAFEAMGLVPNKLETIKDAVHVLLSEVKRGQVYIMSNPAFTGWCKVGMAIDAEDRVKQYQTSSPYRDFELVKAYDTKDKRAAEAEAHAELEKHYDRKGEWFVCDASLAVDKLDNLFEGKQLELF